MIVVSEVQFFVPARTPIAVKLLRKHANTHLANLFGPHILLLCVIHAGGGPSLNQLEILDKIEHFSMASLTLSASGKRTLLTDARKCL